MIDLHMHTTASDGTDTPEELLQNLRKAGISRFSLTDHDTYEASEKVLSMLEGDPELKFTCGIEFSCREGRKKYHILGYGFDPDS